MGENGDDHLSVAPRSPRLCEEGGSERSIRREIRVSASEVALALEVAARDLTGREGLFLSS